MTSKITHVEQNHAGGVTWTVITTDPDENGRIVTREVRVSLQSAEVEVMARRATSNRSQKAVDGGLVARVVSRQVTA